MPFSIQSADIADSSSFATIFLAAFNGDPILGLMWRNVDAEASHAYQTRRFERDFERAALEGTLFFKAVEEESGDIVAFVKWQYPYALSKDEQMENERWEKEHEDPMPEGYNTKLFDEFFAAILRIYRRFVEPTRDFVVHILAVSPKHQRRGLGSLLLRDGLTLSDRDCARTYIESSPVALALYLRHGWKQVGDSLIDIEKYGGEGTASEKCLMREPGGSSRR